MPTVGQSLPKEPFLKHFFCFSLKTGATSIGYLNAIAGGSYLMHILLSILVYLPRQKILALAGPDLEKILTILYHKELSFTLVQGLVFTSQGVLLLMGINKNKSKLLRFWIGIECVFLLAQAILMICVYIIISEKKYFFYVSIPAWIACILNALGLMYVDSYYKVLQLTSSRTTLVTSAESIAGEGTTPRDNPVALF